MIKLEKTSVMNLENAIRGARNPMSSWSKSDSRDCGMCNDRNSECVGDCFILGKNDLGLAKRLCKAGSDHRKFLRQIFVSVDITAPLYWFKEYDTYKVGTTANSTSTMHKIHNKPFEIDDFSHEHLSTSSLNSLYGLLIDLEDNRQKFIETKQKEYWWQMIQLLPSSYNQLRTCTMTYENLFNMILARENHKLDEWHVFCDWALDLPYMKEFLNR